MQKMFTQRTRIQKLFNIPLDSIEESIQIRVRVQVDTWRKASATTTTKSGSYLIAGIKMEVLLHVGCVFVYVD